MLEEVVNTLHQPLRVFLVEDSDLYRALLRRFIQTIDRNFIFEENKSYTIRSFASGEDCLNNLYQNPDIIILDYMLNGYGNNENSIDGMETLRFIKEISPKTHVIIISSQENMVLAAEFLANGATDYVSKQPGVRERLQHAVARAIQLITQTKGNDARHN